eukprot:TRINITY_DN4928_c0_g4_i3.p1 TRINITY_DN4928_c0_g4~~TRINITY_DN4928_c0_g4_i3.p1  ORF type:complete len:133 (-),score=33.51 TRINITY_DN4928_c0_g4_i3:405-803(-)
MTFIPYSPPSAGRSFVAASLFFSLTAALLILNAKLLASSKGLTIVAGFVGSLLFDFALIAISSLIACLASNHESGWAEVLFALATACSFAGSVHGVSVTTCIIFSGIQLFILHNVSQEVYAPKTAAPITKRK